MSPKVSVIMPVYNVEKYLQQSLLSVMHQTLEEIEIICVNDGSTDSSGEILDYYAQKDARIKVITTVNKGYGHAMNTGLNIAEGEYIGIVEPDDYVDIQMFEYLYDVAEIRKADIVKADFCRFTTPLNSNICTFYQAVAENEQYYNHILIPRKDKAVFRFIVNIWCGIYKREMIKKNKIWFNETKGAAFQDNGFWFQTLCYCERLYYIKIPFYMNRRDNQSSSIYDLSNLYAGNKEFSFIKNLIENRPELKEPFLEAYHIKKYQTYKFNLRRCPKLLKMEYVSVISNEWRKELENGELKNDFFRPEEWNEILSIIKDPGKYARQLIEEPTKSFDEFKNQIVDQHCAEYQLEEIRKSFSYKIGMGITSIPRKIISMQEKRKNGKKHV